MWLFVLFRPIFMLASYTQYYFIIQHGFLALLNRLTLNLHAGWGRRRNQLCIFWPRKTAFPVEFRWSPLQQCRHYCASLISLRYRGKPISRYFERQFVMIIIRHQIIMAHYHSSWITVAVKWLWCVYASLVWFWRLSWWRVTLTGRQLAAAAAAAVAYDYDGDDAF